MKVSLVCASASRFNSGMISVDKAWDIFLKRHDLKIEYSKFRFNDISYDGKDNDDYKCLIKNYEDFISADKIVYWGDFLHMHRYHLRKAKMLSDKKIFNSFAEALEFVQKTLLLKSEHKQLKEKTITLGGNLLLESFEDLVQVPHNEALKDLIVNSISYLPRDMYSANLASSIKQDFSFTQGVDCAMIGHGSNFAPNQSYESWITNGENVGVFLGRSVNKIFKMIYFSRQIAKKSKLRTKWISWLHEEEGLNKQNLVKCLVNNVVCNEKSTNSNVYSEDLLKLREFKFIITDTYHLAVNAWCVGVPAICIADIYRANRKENVNSGAEFNWRDKRYMHYMMYDMLDFYVHNNELDSYQAIQKRISHLFETLENQKKIKWIYNRMKQQVSMSEDILLKALLK